MDIEVEEKYNSFWKGIIENEDGSINLEQLKKELFDFSYMLDNVPKVYEHISGGQLSKPMYKAEFVNSVADDHYEESYNMKEEDQISYDEALELLDGSIADLHTLKNNYHENLTDIDDVIDKLNKFYDNYFIYTT